MRAAFKSPCRIWRYLAMVVLLSGGPATADDHDTKAGSDAQPAHEAKPHRAIATTLIVTGAITMAGGLTLTTLGENEYAAPRGQVQPEYYRDTEGVGIGTFVGGAIVTGLGAYLYLHARNDRPLVAMPVAAPTTGGAVVGLSSRF